jgi:hypothetical protein
METNILPALKAQVLTLDKDTGVSPSYFRGVNDLIRQNMGVDASVILSDAMEADEDGNFYFPNPGDASRTWKRMMVAYKAEKGLDNSECLVG